MRVFSPWLGVWVSRVQLALNVDDLDSANPFCSKGFHSNPAMVKPVGGSREVAAWYTLITHANGYPAGTPLGPCFVS